eukprot:3842712-Ditylum_brightwellii.AAC.1
MAAIPKVPSVLKYLVLLLIVIFVGNWGDDLYLEKDGHKLKEEKDKPVDERMVDEAHLQIQVLHAAGGQLQLDERVKYWAF